MQCRFLALFANYDNSSAPYQSSRYLCKIDFISLFHCGSIIVFHRPYTYIWWEEYKWYLRTKTNADVVRVHRCIKKRQCTWMSLFGEGGWQLPMFVDSCWMRLENLERKFNTGLALRWNVDLEICVLQCRNSLNERWLASAFNRI